MLRGDLGEVGGELLGGLVERGEAGFGFERAARQFGGGGVGAGAALLGLAQGGEGSLLGGGGLLPGGTCRRRHAGRLCRDGLGCRDLARQRGEAVAVAELLRGRRGAGGAAGEPVPAPQPPVTVDEALSGAQLLLQRAPFGLARDPAGLGE